MRYTLDEVLEMMEAYAQSAERTAQRTESPFTHGVSSGQGAAMRTAIDWVKQTR